MIKPWGSFVAVIDPPAETNDGTHNGVVLPEGFGLDVMDKGIVIGVGASVEQWEGKPEGFSVGAAVWYRHGDSAMKIADIKFVQAQDLVCWEPSPSAVES